MSRADHGRYRAMITASGIGTTPLQSLDRMIACVAPAYRLGSFSASYGEITRVPASFIAAAS
jgi:hypothetical protein